ncbi:MAG: hypothetical protein H0W72_01275 [Planctomycetes bacterium]|nr:hypothetical protein [Planctomycetota bacterium]
MTPLIITAAIGAFLLILVIALNAFYRTVEQGHALIINKLGHLEPTVTFTGAMVMPVIHRAEVMDISVKTIEVDRNGANGLICKDNIRADIKVTFFVRVNKTREDVVKVAGSVGVARASDTETLAELFEAKFSEALKTVGKRMEFIDLYNQRDTFKDEIVKVIGRDLSGYNLEDAAIDYLEQTPLKMLDPDNILDSEGRKKIIDLTSTQRVMANEIQREAEKTIKKQDVEAKEAMLSLERQQAEAEARQGREIATTRARETAEQHKVEAEQRQLSEGARIASEQEIGIARENAQREVQVAEKNREGAVAVEYERVEKARQLEAINRERAVEISGIEKEKIIAIERKNIAEVIRERVSVEKAVAEEEELTKNLRAFMEADRHKKVTVAHAEAAAEQVRIKEVTAAIGSEQAAGHLAKERMITADADLNAAEKDALARTRRAEGMQAETAAPGLAHARVMEAEAEARRKQGLAEVHVQEASAKAIELVGQAEAGATEVKMLAEAKGLAEKAVSMSKLTAETKAHEEFRLRLEKEFELARERIAGQVKVSEQNAVVLGQALSKAKFDIVGGDGEFFERFVKAVSVGKGLDATVQHSETLKILGKDYLSGEQSLPGDVKDVLLNTSMGSGDVKNLTVSAMLSRMMAGKDPVKVDALLAKARELGFVDHPSKVN